MTVRRGTSKRSHKKIGDCEQSTFLAATLILLFLYYIFLFLGESIPIRLFLAGYELTPTFKDVNKKFSVRYFLNLVLVDEEERRYFKQQVCHFFY